MQEVPHRKPGDRVIRRAFVRPLHLRRVLGVAALYSAGYGNVGSSIYYALGIVALVALGATPIALLAAGVLFVFTALSYSEGATMYPEAGGSASFARHGFNEHIGFVAGWALLLSYIVTISISAFTISPYLGFFWEPLKTEPWIGTLFSIGIVVFLMGLNIIGVRETAFINIGAAVVDVVTQVLLVLIGIVLIFTPGIVEFSVSNLYHHMFDVGNWPTTGNLIFGVALAALAYTGVETVSQMSEETRLPHVRVPIAMILMMFTVLIMFSGISVVALSTMPPDVLAGEWARDPVAGIASKLPFSWLRSLFEPFVAVLAATILLIATNAGLMGISRLAFSMGSLGHLPSAFKRMHNRFRTPYVSIAVFSLVAVVILVPGLFLSNIVEVFADLGGLYTFGSLMAFAFAHASIIALRIRKPDAERPFRLRPNIKIRGRDLPITAIIGLIATVAVWLVIIIEQDYSRWMGIGWMVIGIGSYSLYRWRKRKQQALETNEPGQPLKTSEPNKRKHQS